MKRVYTVSFDAFFFELIRSFPFPRQRAFKEDLIRDQTSYYSTPSTEGNRISSEATWQRSSRYLKTSVGRVNIIESERVSGKEEIEDLVEEKRKKRKERQRQELVTLHERAQAYWTRLLDLRTDEWGRFWQYLDEFIESLRSSSYFEDVKTRILRLPVDGGFWTFQYRERGFVWTPTRISPDDLGKKDLRRRRIVM